MSVGLTVVPDEGRLDAGGRLDDGGGDADVGDVAGLELPDAGAAGLILGAAVLAGPELAGQEGEPVAWAAFLLPVALVLAAVLPLAVAVDVAVALLLAVAVDVTLAEAVPVAEVLSLSLGLTLVLPLLPGLPLTVPLAGAVPEPVGGTLGSTLLDLADLDVLAGEVGDRQTVACALLWLAAELEELAPPFAEPAALPAPFRVGVPWVGLEEVIPTAELSWTKASRSGGRARTTPMANTAQAPARIGLSSPSRQSRCCGRARSLPPRAESPLPRTASRRPVSQARKPPAAAERLLAWGGPDRTRARIRSSPSGWGST